jgi:energy-coupling factor transport system ATP-binding protein
LTGLYKQNIGQISISEKITKRKQRIKSTFFVQQDSDYQLYAPTVEDEFRIGKTNKALSRSEIETILENVGLKDVIDRQPIPLSGGQKQRLLLALAAVSTKEILVLDEPTSGLDGYNMRLTAELLKKMAWKGHCVILITHDLELITLASDSLLYMDKGKILYHRHLK